MTESGDRNVLAICLARIEQKLAWGASSSWVTQDFEQLSEQIRLATGVSLSVTTLKRIWGKVRYESAPTLSTLNALSGFLGYANWHSFKQAIQPVAVQPSPEPPVSLTTVQPTHVQRWLILGLIVGVSGLVAFFVQQQEPRVLHSGDFLFRSRRVTTGLPNSVIFTYDVTKAPTDSVFIQQS